MLNNDDPLLALTIIFSKRFYFLPYGKNKLK